MKLVLPIFCRQMFLGLLWALSTAYLAADDSFRVLHVNPEGNTGWRVGWQSTPGHLYRLQVNDTLNPTTWQTVLETNAPDELTDAVDPGTSVPGELRFWRVIRLTPAAGIYMSPIVAYLDAETSLTEMAFSVIASSPDNVTQVAFYTGGTLRGVAENTQDSWWVLKEPYNPDHANEVELFAEATDGAGAVAQSEPARFLLVDPRRFVPMDEDGTLWPGHFPRVESDGSLQAFEYRPDGRAPASQQSGLTFAFAPGAQLLFSGGEYRIETEFGVEVRMGAFDSSPLSLPSGTTRALTLDAFEKETLSQFLGLSPGDPLLLWLIPDAPAPWTEGFLGHEGLAGIAAAPDLEGMGLAPLPGPPQKAERVLDPRTGEAVYRYSWWGTFLLPGGAELRIPRQAPWVFHLYNDWRVELGGETHLRMPSGARMSGSVFWRDGTVGFSLSAHQLTLETLGSLKDLLPPDPNTLVPGAAEDLPMNVAEEAMLATRNAYRNFAAGAIRIDSEDRDREFHPLLQPANTATAALEAWGWHAVAQHAGGHSLGGLAIDALAQLTGHAGKSAASAHELPEMVLWKQGVARLAAVAGDESLDGVFAEFEEEFTAALRERVLNGDPGEMVAALERSVEAWLDLVAEVERGGAELSPDVRELLGEWMGEVARAFFIRLGVEADEFDPLLNPAVLELNRFSVASTLTTLLNLRGLAQATNTEDALADLPVDEATHQLVTRFLDAHDSDYQDVLRRGSFEAAMIFMRQRLDLMAEIQLLGLDEEFPALFNQPVVTFRIEEIAQHWLNHPSRPNRRDSLLEALRFVSRILDVVPEDAASHAEAVHGDLRGLLGDFMQAGRFNTSLRGEDWVEWLEGALLAERLGRNYFDLADLTTPVSEAEPRSRLKILVDGVVKVSGGEPASTLQPEFAFLDRAAEHLAEAIRVLGEEIETLPLMPAELTARRESRLAHIAALARLLSGYRRVATRIYDDAANAPGTLAWLGDVLLPGDIRVHNLAGAARFNPSTGFMAGRFSGDVALPKFNARLSVPRASFDTRGNFHLNAFGQSSVPGSGGDVVIRVPARRPLAIRVTDRGRFSLAGGAELALPGGHTVSGYLSIDDPEYVFELAYGGALRFEMLSEISLLRPVIDPAALPDMDTLEAVAAIFASVGTGVESFLGDAQELDFPSAADIDPGATPEFVAPVTTIPLDALDAWVTTAANENVIPLLNGTLLDTREKLRDMIQTVGEPFSAAKAMVEPNLTLLQNLLKTQEAFARAREIASSTPGFGDDPEVQAAFLKAAGEMVAAADNLLETLPENASLPMKFAAVRFNIDAHAEGQLLGLVNTPDTALQAQVLNDGAAQLYAQAGLGPTGAIVNAEVFNAASASQVFAMAIATVRFAENQQMMDLDAPEDYGVVRETLLEHAVDKVEAAHQQAVNTGDVAEIALNIIRLLVLNAEFTDPAGYAVDGLVDNDIRLTQMMEALEARHQDSANRKDVARSLVDNAQLLVNREVEAALAQSREILGESDNSRKDLLLARKGSPSFLETLDQHWRFLLERGVLDPTRHAQQKNHLRGWLRASADALLDTLADLALTSGDPATVEFVESNFRRVHDTLALTVDTLVFLDAWLAEETELIEDLTASWQPLHLTWVEVAEARKAWWLLSESVKNLSAATRRYGAGLDDALETALHQAAGNALFSLQAVTNDLATFLNGFSLEDFLFPLPGDLVVNRLFGRLEFNRITSDWRLLFGGAVRFPEINLALTADTASLASNGDFTLALRTSGPMPFGFDDELRLDISNAFSLGGNLLDLTLSNASANGTLTRESSPGNIETYSMQLGYTFTPAPPPLDVEGKGTHRFAFGLEVGGDLEIFTEDLVVFRGGLGFVLSVDENFLPEQGEFTVSTSVGILLKDGAEQPWTPDDFELRLDGQAVVTVNGEENSIALSGTLLLPVGYHAQACGSAGGVPSGPGLGRPVVSLPAANPLTFLYRTGNHPDPDLRDTVRSEGSFALNDLRFSVAGFERLWVDVCSLEFAFVFDTGTNRPSARLRDLNAILNLPLSEGNDVKVGMATADWNLNRLPTQGSISLLDDLVLFDEGGFRARFVGGEVFGIPTSFVALYPPDGENPLPRFRVQGTFNAGVEGWFTLENGDPATLYSEAQNVWLEVDLPDDRLPSVFEGDFTWSIGAIEFGCDTSDLPSCNLRLLDGVLVKDPRLRLVNPLSVLSPSAESPFEVELDLGFVFQNLSGADVTIEGKKFTLIFNGSPQSPLIKADEFGVTFAGTDGAPLTPSVFPLYVRKFGVAFKNFGGEEGVPMFPTQENQPPAFSHENLEFTISAGLQFTEEEVQILYGEVDDLVVSFPEGEPTLSVDGIGVGVDLSYFLGEDFPFAGKVYLSGLQSDGFFLSGMVGANIAGTMVTGIVALNQDGPVGLCVGFGLGAQSIHLFKGFVLSGARGGIIRGTGTQDPCAFVEKYQINSITGLPGNLDPDEEEDPPPVICTGYAQSHDELSFYRSRNAEERDQLALEARALEVARRVLADTGISDKEAREFAGSIEGDIEDVNEAVNALVSLHDLTPIDQADLVDFDCPPASLGPTAQMHPDASDPDSPYFNRAIWKFTSVDEATLNFFGINRARIDSIVPQIDFGDLLDNPRGVASDFAEEVRLGIEARLPRPPAEAPGILNQYIDGEQVQVAYDTFILELLDNFELGLYNAINCNLQALGEVLDREQFVDDVWNGLREAAYAGLVYEDLTIRLQGSFSYLGLSAFASVTGGVVVSPTNNTMGVHGSIDVFGIPTGQISAYVVPYDAMGNPNLIPAVCGEIIAAIGPLEFGTTAFLYDFPGTVERVLTAFGTLGETLSAPYVYEIMLAMDPDKAIPNAGVAEHLALLETDDEKFAFLSTMFQHLPGPDAGLMYTAVRQWFIDLLDAVVVRTAFKASAQPKVFGFPLSGENAFVSIMGYVGPEDLETYAENPGIVSTSRVAFSPFQMATAPIIIATGSGGAVAAAFIPAVDQAVMRHREPYPTLGTLFDEITSLSFPEFIDQRFRAYINNTVTTFEYSLSPLGLELSRAGGRLVFPSYDHHPVGNNALAVPADLPTRREVLRAALGGTGTDENYLADINWAGTGSEIAALFAGTEYEDVFLAVPQDQWPQLRDHYFPHGGFVGAATIGVPLLISQGIPASYYTVVNPGGSDVLEWLAALAEFIDYLGSTEPGGELGFYVPAPNPPSFLTDGFPTSPLALMNDLRNFDPVGETLGMYPIEQAFFSARWGAPFFGMPLADGFMELDFSVPMFLFEAKTPEGSWITEFLGANILLEAEMQLGPDAEAPLTNVSALLLDLLPIKDGATFPYEPDDFESLTPQEMSDLLDQVRDILARRMPRGAMFFEGQIATPAWLGDFVQPAGGGNSVEARFFAYTPMYDPDYMPENPAHETHPHTLARRQGGVGFEGNFEMGWFPGAGGSTYTLSIEDAAFLMLPGVNPAVPRVVASLDVDQSGFSHGMFNFEDLRLRIDTEPPPGGERVRFEGRVPAPAIPGVFEVVSDAGDGRVGGQLTLLEDNALRMRFEPMTATFPILGGVTASLTGFEEDGGFSFSNVSGEEWAVAFELGGTFQIRNPLDPVNGDTILQLEPESGQPPLEATLVGNGLDEWRLTVNGSLSGQVTLFPDTEHAVTHPLPGGQAFTILMDEQFRLYVDFGALENVALPGNIQAGARLEFGYNPGDPQPQLAVRKDGAVFDGPLAFGTINLAESKAEEIELRNTGLRNLTLSASLVQNGADYTLSTGTMQIEPGGSRSLTVLFQPKAAGARNAQLHIASNDPGNPLQVINLTGAGQALPLYMASRPSVDFGDTLVNASSTSTFTVGNEGSANLVVQSASVTGAAFSVTPTGSQTIVPGDSRTYTLTFTPTTLGESTGSLNLQIAAPIGAQSIPLSGTGSETRWVTVLDAETADNDATLHALRMIDVDRGFVVGDGGAFLQTLDGGRSWIPRDITRENLRAIAIANGAFPQPPVALYHFDEPPGSTVYLDASGNERHGIVDSDSEHRPARSFLSGRFGSGLRFDGVNDTGELAVFAMPASFSISVWVNYQNQSNDQVLVGKHSDTGGLQFELRRRNTSSYRVRFGGNNLDFPANSGLTGWVHLLLTCTHSSGNSTLRLYENNVLKDTHTVSGTVTASTSNRWRIGSRWHPSNGTSLHFHGSMDELFIFDGVVNATLRQRLYTSNLDRMVVAGDKGRVFESYNHGALWAQHPDLNAAGWNNTLKFYQNFDYRSAYLNNEPRLYLAGSRSTFVGPIGAIMVEGVGDNGEIASPGVPGNTTLYTGIAGGGSRVRATTIDQRIHAQNPDDSSFSGPLAPFEDDGTTYGGALNAIDFHSTSTLGYVAVGNSGHLVRGGDILTSPTAAHLRGIRYRSNVNPGYHAVGDNGVYLTSSNQGADWQVVQDGLSGQPRAVDVVRHPGGASTQYHAWAAGQYHEIQYRPNVAPTGAFMTFYPGKLDFGFVLVDEPQTRSLRVTNRGRQPLGITGVALQGPAAARFQLAQTSLSSLPPGGSLTLRVRYLPTAPSTLDSAEVVISTNDPLRPVFRVPLEGRADERTWRPVTLLHGGQPVTGEVKGVRFTSETRGYALVTPTSGPSLFFRTNNGGETWVGNTLPTTWGILRMEAIDAVRHENASGIVHDHIYLVGFSPDRNHGDVGILVRGTTSTTFFQTPGWSNLTPIPVGETHQPHPLADVSVLSVGTDVWVSTSTLDPAEGNLWNSSNGGSTWFVSPNRPGLFAGGPVSQFAFQSGGFPSSLWNISFAASGPGLFVRVNDINGSPGDWDSSSEIVRTPYTFHDIHILPTFFFYGAQQAIGWAVGESGNFIMWTGNMTSPWFPAKDAEVFGTTNLSSVHSGNASAVWVVGESKIFDSRDFGHTWKLNFDTGEAATLNSVHSLDADRAWTGGALNGQATVWRYTPPPSTDNRLLSALDDMDWGSLSPGAGANRTIPLTNLGSDPLTIHEIRIESDEPRERFRLLGTMPTSLGPFQTHNLVVRFDATEDESIAEQLRPEFYFRFENEWGAEILTDDSPNARHAHVAQQAESTRPALALSQHRDRCLHFNGAQHLLLNTVPGPDTLTESYAIAMWIAPESLTGTHTLIAKEQSNGADVLRLALTTGGYHVRMRGNNVVVGPVPETGWHHVAFNFQESGGNTHFTLHINGSPAGQGTLPVTFGDGAGLPWILGAEHVFSSLIGNRFQGSMDDVLLVPRALSTGEIRRLASKSPLYGDHRARLTIRTGADDPLHTTALRARVTPNPRLVTFNTQPQGLPVTIDGVAHTAPVSFAVVPYASGAPGAREWIEGSTHRISVGDSVVLDPEGAAMEFAFAGWSGAPGQSFDLTASRTVPATHTAAFTPVEVQVPPVPPPPLLPPGGDPLIQALATAPAGPFLRITNGHLTLPQFQDAPLAITGELLISPERIEGWLNSPAMDLPAPGVHTIVRLGEGNWRVDAVAGDFFRMTASPPSISLYGYPVVPDGMAEIAFEQGQGSDPGAWTLAFDLLEDFKPVPRMVEFKKGRVELGWLATTVPSGFNLTFNGGLRLIQLPNTLYAVDRNFAFTLGGGEFDVGLSDLFAAAGTPVPATLFNSGPFRVDWGDIRLRRTADGTIRLDLHDLDFRFNNNLVMTVAGEVDSAGNLLLTGALPDSGELRLDTQNRFRLRNTGDATALLLEISPGALALEVPSLRLETSAGDASGNTLPNGVDLPGIRFASNGTFDTGRLPLPGTLAFAGMNVQGPASGSLAQNHMRLRRDASSRVTFDLKARQMFVTCRQNLNLSITASGTAAPVVAGSMSGNFCVLPRNVSLNFNPASACAFSGSAFGFSIHYGSSCAGVRNEATNFCILGSCP